MKEGRREFPRVPPSQMDLIVCLDDKLGTSALKEKKKNPLNPNRWGLGPCLISKASDLVQHERKCLFFFRLSRAGSSETVVNVFSRHQGGQSDSGMGLSSDNMQTLKRLESLAGRRLSIMALRYVQHTSARTFGVQGQRFPGKPSRESGLVGLVGFSSGCVSNGVFFCGGGGRWGGGGDWKGKIFPWSRSADGRSARTAWLGSCAALTGFKAGLFSRVTHTRLIPLAAAASARGPGFWNRVLGFFTARSGALAQCVPT